MKSSALPRMDALARRATPCRWLCLRKQSRPSVLPSIPGKPGCCQATCARSLSLCLPGCACTCKHKIIGDMRFTNPKVVVALAPLRPTIAAAHVSPTGIFPTALDAALFYPPREIEHFDTAAAHASASARALWARSTATQLDSLQQRKQTKRRTRSERTGQRIGWPLLTFPFTFHFSFSFSFYIHVYVTLLYVCFS